MPRVPDALDLTVRRVFQHIPPPVQGHLHPLSCGHAFSLPGRVPPRPGTGARMPASKRLHAVPGAATFTQYFAIFSSNAHLSKQHAGLVDPSLARQIGGHFGVGGLPVMRASHLRAAPWFQCRGRGGLECRTVSPNTIPSGNTGPYAREMSAVNDNRKDNTLYLFNWLNYLPNWLWRLGGTGGSVGSVAAWFLPDGGV